MHLRPIIDLSNGEDKHSRAREGETGAMDYDIMCTVLCGGKGRNDKGAHEI
jgi:hypothetical protein